MSTNCIHYNTWRGNYYEPPEAWCDLGRELDCANCPKYYSIEDYEYDLSDEYYDSSFDFIENF